MQFRDGEVLDGLLPNDLLSWDVAGFTVTPPEAMANNQKVFVPREALRGIQVLGVVGSPAYGAPEEGKNARRSANFILTWGIMTWARPAHNARAPR